MEIGTLNQRITFLVNRVVTDEIGNHTAMWDETFSCWARVTLKSSVENTEAGVTKETQKLEFLIRQSRNWMPSVTGNRILFRDVTYNITSVTPDYLHKDYLKLTAEARKAGQNDQYCDNLAEEIMQGLQEYADIADTAMKKAVRKTATQVKNEISANAPKDTGKYAKSWATKKTGENSHSLEMTVHSKNRYQLAHLLEKGHAKRGGGRVSGKPHISPAEENGVQLLEHLIEGALS